MFPVLPAFWPSQAWYSFPSSFWYITSGVWSIYDIPVCPIHTGFLSVIITTGLEFSRQEPDLQHLIQNITPDHSYSFLLIGYVFPLFYWVFGLLWGIFMSCIFLDCGWQDYSHWLSPRAGLTLKSVHLNCGGWVVHFLSTAFTNLRCLYRHWLPHSFATFQLVTLITGLLVRYVS